MAKRQFNTQNRGITEAEFYKSKAVEKGIPGDMSSFKGIERVPGIEVNFGGIPHVGGGDYKTSEPTVKRRCDYGEDFDAPQCGAYPAKGTPYCAGHLRKLGQLD